MRRTVFSTSAARAVQCIIGPFDELIKTNVETVDSVVVCPSFLALVSLLPLATYSLTRRFVQGVC